MTDAKAVAERIRRKFGNTRYAVDELEALSGGTANRVFLGRLRRPLDDGTECVIIKHSEAFVAANPQYPLPTVRCHIEAALLPQLPTTDHHPPNANSDELSESPRSERWSVVTPKLLHWEPSSHDQVVAFFPHTCSLQAYLSPPYRPRPNAVGQADDRNVLTDLGRAWGKWLHEFHVWANSEGKVGAGQSLGHPRISSGRANSTDEVDPSKASATTADSGPRKESVNESAKEPTKGEPPQATRQASSDGRPSPTPIRDMAHQNEQLRALKHVINYGRLADMAAAYPEELGADADVLEEIRKHTLAELMDPDSLEVIHGDMWPGNVLVGADDSDEGADDLGEGTEDSGEGADDSGEGEDRVKQTEHRNEECSDREGVNALSVADADLSQPKRHPNCRRLMVVDWETLQLGWTWSDVGQTVAELYLAFAYHDVVAALWVLQGFLKAYTEARRQADRQTADGQTADRQTADADKDTSGTGRSSRESQSKGPEESQAKGCQGPSNVSVGPSKATKSGPGGGTGNPRQEAQHAHDQLPPDHRQADAHGPTDHRPLDPPPGPTGPPGLPERNASSSAPTASTAADHAADHAADQRFAFRTLVAAATHVISLGGHAATTAAAEARTPSVKRAARDVLVAAWHEDRAFFRGHQPWDLLFDDR